MATGKSWLENRGENTGRTPVDDTSTREYERAALAVAQRSHGLADCRHLLDVLGLIDDDNRPVGWTPRGTR